jgi:6-phosphogluconolactonase (cycloisomerase 2 family)
MPAWFPWFVWRSKVVKRMVKPKRQGRTDKNSTILAIQPPDSTLFVCGNNSASIGGVKSYTFNFNVSSFANCKDANRIQSISASKSLGTHFVMIARYF